MWWVNYCSFTKLKPGLFTLYYEQSDPWPVFCSTVGDHVPRLGGYSEMACSQTTPTLWVLPALTWLWKTSRQHAGLIWRWCISGIFLLSKREMWCGDGIDLLIFRTQDVLFIVSLSSMMKRLRVSQPFSVRITTWAAGMTTAAPLTDSAPFCHLCREEQMPTGSSTSPCLPPSTTMSAQTSEITAWAASQYLPVYKKSRLIVI